MKKILFVLFCLVSISVSGQQYLWSTTHDSTIKWGDYVSTEDVQDKVLEYYDQYEFYFDGSGYNKEGFFKYFESSRSNKNSNSVGWKALKKKILEITDLTVFSYKDNLGHGSVILVMCVTKEHVNLIIFSNTYERDAILTGDYNKNKFASWFQTLLK